MVAQQTLTLFVWVQILVPLPKSLGLREPRLFYEVWLSLVERYVRDVEAAGSNPVTSTTSKPPKNGGLEPFFGGLFFAFGAVWSLFGLYRGKNGGFPVVGEPLFSCFLEEYVVQHLGGGCLGIFDGLGVDVQRGAGLAVAQPGRYGPHVHAPGDQ